jgi:hypothetical protein
MVSPGEPAPTFTATYSGSDHQPFDLVSDMAGDAIKAYGLSLDIPDLGRYGVATARCSSSTRRAP